MVALTRSSRAVALVAAAAVAVHELRYAIGFAGEEGHVAHDEHAYLALGVSLVSVLIVVAACLFARSVREAARTGVAGARPPAGFALTWLWLSAALVAIYTGQELLEPLFAVGHPGGLSGVLGHAGWTVLVWAPLLGGVVALLLRQARAVIVRAAAQRSRRTHRRVTGSSRSTAEPRLVSPAPPLALHLAGRAPPTLLH